MRREFDFLTGLYPVYPLAPKPLAFYDDTRVLGDPFFIMECRDGLVLHDHFPDCIKPSATLGRNLSMEVVKQLTSLHLVNYHQAGLASFGHPDGYLARQVAGWTKRYHNSVTEGIAVDTAIVRWLENHVPRVSLPATIIHNDFKLNSLLLGDGGCRVIAVLDWEMATIGDPLEDLAIALSYWIEPGDTS